MPDLKTFREDLKHNKLRHAYLFTVREEYEFHQVLSEIKKKYLPEGLEDFNFDSLTGEETSLSEIVNMAATAPMMSEKRIVLVKNAEKIGDSGIERFTEFIEIDREDSLLILAAGENIPSTGWAKLLKKNGMVIEFDKLDEKNITGWIINYLKKKGYSINTTAAKLLVSQIGNNLDLITRQLDKAMLCFNPGEMIDDDSLQKLVLRSRRHNYWELSDAAAERNLKKTLLILNEMLDDGEPEVVILGILNNFFYRLLTARNLLSSGVHPEKVCDIIGQKWYRDKFLKQVSRFSQGKLEKVFSEMRQADENIKTGYMTVRDNLERLVYSICGDYHSFPKVK